MIMTDQKKLKRRRFLKIAGGAVLATAAVGSGLIVAGTRQPPIDLLETTYTGGNAMSKKILVAYASKCGSTAEVADVIGKNLQQQGFAVDVRLAKKVTDVSAYQGVIVGSAIRIGRWLPAATKFVKTHQQALSNVPIAYFEVCGELNEGETEAHQRVAESYLEPVRAIVKPVEVGLFAGKMDYSKLSFLNRLMIERFIKSPEGDWRNWDAIRTWSDKVSLAFNQ
jgi:menaquinone-dependent protoporphyrinogen oxidase